MLQIELENFYSVLLLLNNAWYPGSQELDVNYVEVCDQRDTRIKCTFKILFIDLTSIVFALWPERYTSLNISFSICIDANFNAHTMINHFNCFFQCALQH